MSRAWVDSQDLSLNISREMLQHDRQLKLIATPLEKKISSELSSMLNNDREKYEEFFQNFGLQLKYGMYDNYGAKKDELKDLVLFASSEEKEMTTLQEVRFPDEAGAKVHLLRLRRNRRADPEPAPGRSPAG